MDGHPTKFLRARIRHALFTVVPDRLTGGRLRARHLSQPIELTKIALAPKGWPRGFDGFKIAHLSDFHFGHLASSERIREAVATANAAQPDLVALTGDLVDLHADDCDLLFAELAQLRAPCGIYMVLGNHDHLHAPRKIIKAAREVGITVLMNSTTEVRRAGDALVVGGIDWSNRIALDAARLDAMDALPQLLLAHNPKAFASASSRSIPLTLAGHTHGGQIARRTRPQHNLAFSHRFSSGLYERDGSHLIVTRGVGAWFPLRVHCPPEVVLVEVQATSQ